MHDVAELARDAERALKRFFSAAIGTFTGIKDAEVVEDREHRAHLVLLLECDEREPKVCDCLIGSALNVRHNAKVLLHHSGERAIGKPMRESSGLAEPPFGSDKIAPDLRNRTQAVQYVSTATFVT